MKKTLALLSIIALTCAAHAGEPTYYKYSTLPVYHRDRAVDLEAQLEEKEAEIRRLTEQAEDPRFQPYQYADEDNSFSAEFRASAAAYTNAK